MPMNPVDLVGKVFGRLTVIQRVGSKHGKSLWLCQCRCGKTTETLSTSLTRGPLKGNRKGGTESCGKCQDKEKYPKEYSAWTDMRQRCMTTTHPSYSYYGGRGITVCFRWHDFLNFLEDIGPAPHSDLSLERKDTNGNYEKDNCTWATWSEQMKNRRFHNQHDH